jgi:uncharacterized membrane protein
MDENHGSGLSPKDEETAIGCLYLTGAFVIILLVGWIITLLGK